MNQLPERDLPPGRHRLLKEHLMTEIRQAPVRRTGTWLRPALVAGAVAAVTAVTLTLAAPSQSTPDASKEAVALLEDIALAAEQADTLKIRDDQFVYIKSKVGWSVHEEGKPAFLEPIHEREVWLSVDGSEQGMLHDPVVRADHELLEKNTPGIPSNTNYRHLQTLPTDPDRMFDWLNSVSEGSDSKDEANFVLVGDLARESLMPCGPGSGPLPGGREDLRRLRDRRRRRRGRAARRGGRPGGRWGAGRADLRQEDHEVPRRAGSGRRGSPVGLREGRRDGAHRDPGADARGQAG